MWIGLGTLLGSRSEVGTVTAPAGAGFRRGFLMNAANPKLLVYCIAILPQFLDPAGPVALQVGVLGVTSIVIELAILLGYAALAGRSRQFVRTPGALRWLDRCGGALLVAAATRVAALRRGDAAAALP